MRKDIFYAIERKYRQNQVKPKPEPKPKPKPEAKNGQYLILL